MQRPNSLWSKASGQDKFFRQSSCSEPGCVTLYSPPSPFLPGVDLEKSTSLWKTFFMFPARKCRNWCLDLQLLSGLLVEKVWGGARRTCWQRSCGSSGSFPWRHRSRAQPCAHSEKLHRFLPPVLSRPPLPSRSRDPRRKMFSSFHHSQIYKCKSPAQDGRGRWWTVQVLLIPFITASRTRTSPRCIIKWWKLCPESSPSRDLFKSPQHSRGSSAGKTDSITLLSTRDGGGGLHLRETRCPRVSSSPSVQPVPARSSPAAGAPLRPRGACGRPRSPGGQPRPKPSRRCPRSAGCRDVATPEGGSRVRAGSGARGRRPP